MSQVDILAAVYGAAGGALDTTQAVQKLVDGGSTLFNVTNQNMGGDPKPGTLKSVAVVYIAGGARLTAVGTEGGTVNLLPPKLVLGAVYGANTGSEDVTAAVQTMVDAGTTTITANNQAFGDPAVGYAKQFALTWINSSGNAQTAVCAENGSISL